MLYHLTHEEYARYALAEILSNKSLRNYRLIVTLSLPILLCVLMIIRPVHSFFMILGLLVISLGWCYFISYIWYRKVLEKLTDIFIKKANPLLGKITLSFDAENDEYVLQNEERKSSISRSNLLYQATSFGKNKCIVRDNDGNIQMLFREDVRKVTH